MPFTIDRWRADLHDVLEAIAADPQGACERAGQTEIYPLLLGAAMQPIVAAYEEAPNGVISALISVAGSLGVNLAANLMQRAYLAGNLLAIAAREAQSAELAPAYDRMASSLNLVDLAESALAAHGHDELQAQVHAAHARRQRETSPNALAFGAPRRP